MLADVSFELVPRGPFSLASAAAFAEGFPATEARREGGGELAIAFALDGGWGTVGVRLREEDATVVGDVFGEADEARVRDEVAAILSLDTDGSGFAEVGRRDPVVGRLQERLPGLRPVLFWSPYEAAAWAIIGHRIQMRQAARIKRRMSEELGVTVDVGGTPVTAFPAPDRLADLPAGQAGLNERKEAQLRALGRAALEGALDRARLRAMDRETATGALQELPGIGPFSAELVRVRGVGDPDAFPLHERRVAAIVRAEYGLTDDAPQEELERIAEVWRPYRSWVSLLLRASRMSG